MGWRESFWRGVSDSRGFFVSTFLFGLLFGAAAVSHGIERWHTLFMSMAVFSASAQFAALEYWQSPLPQFTIALSVALVSTRNILLGMAMTHHLDGHSMVSRLGWLSLLTDPAVVSVLRVTDAAEKLAYLVGYGFALYASWAISTVVGMELAGAMPGVENNALGFAGPLVMTTMMVLFARGNTGQLPSWLLSGVVAIGLMESGAPSWSLLPAAVLAGALLTLWRGSRRAG